MTEFTPSLNHIAALMEWLSHYARRTIVIKIGGNSIAEDPGFLDSVAQQMEFLVARHVRVVLVHGGGPQIDQALREAKLVPQKGPDGRRLTDGATMAVVARVMESMSALVADACVARGGQAIAPALGGKRLVEAVPLSNDRAGRPTTVDAAAINALLDDGKIVVLNPLARGQDGSDYNTNADDFALAVARALHAERLIMATNVAGVYDAQRQTISRLTPSRAAELVAAGVIAGGMIPKVESALAALDAGVGGVAIINAHQPWSILAELLTPEGFGTLITKT